MRVADEVSVASIAEEPCPHCGLTTVLAWDFVGAVYGTKARRLKTIRPHRLRACAPCGALYVDGVMVASLIGKEK